MNKDIRLCVDLFEHPKIRRLRRRLGDAGLLALIRLWTQVAKFHPKGDIGPLDLEVLAEMADWDGDPELLFNTLAELKLLEITDENVSVHDWTDHNGWASNAPERSQRAREAAKERWNKRYGECVSHAPSIPPSPSPTPSPSPSPTPMVGEKIRVREFVFLTKEQRDELSGKYGQERFARMLDKLNGYKGQSSKNRKRYDSDYHAIQNWVAPEVLQQASPPKLTPKRAYAQGRSL